MDPKRLSTFTKAVEGPLGFTRDRGDPDEPYQWYRSSAHGQGGYWAQITIIPETEEVILTLWDVDKNDEEPYMELTWPTMESFLNELDWRKHSIDWWLTHGNLDDFAYPPPAPTPTSMSSDIDTINAHRRKLGMGKIVPSDWSEKELAEMAESIRKHGRMVANPRTKKAVASNPSDRKKRLMR